MSVQYLRAVYTCDQCRTETEIEPDETRRIPAGWTLVQGAPGEANRHYCAGCIWEQTLVRERKEKPPAEKPPAEGALYIHPQLIWRTS